MTRRIFSAESIQTIWIPLLLVTGASLYLLKKSVFLSHPPNDYQFIWLAGLMWQEGGNPYSSEFGRLGQEFFQSLSPPQVWFYPPSWWPIATASAMTSFETGITVWRGIGALCIILSSFLVYRAYVQNIGPVTRLRAAAFFAFAACMSGTPIAMAIGQTSFLSYLGVAMFISAYFSKQKVVMVVALFFLMLKPQIGLPFCFFLLADRTWWTCIIAAALLSIVSSLPALRASGVTGFLVAYMDGISFHESMQPNHPREMTGLRSLGFDLFNWRVPPLVLTFLASAAAFGTNFLGDSEGDPRKAALKISRLLAAVGAIVALHTYDMVILTPIIILCMPLGTRTQLAVLFGMLLIFRANNMAEITGFYDQTTTHFIGSRITTIGLMLVVLSLAIPFRPEILSSDYKQSRRIPVKNLLMRTRSDE